MTSTAITIARSEEEVRACWPPMHELRPHLDETTFVQQVMRQRQQHAYTLVAMTDAQGTIVAVTGFRIAEYLAWGKTLYVDDLVTRESARKHGHGGALLDWLIAHARSEGCAQLHLDSGVQRHDAHRLYLNRKLQITSHHFAIKLS